MPHPLSRVKATAEVNVSVEALSLIPEFNDTVLRVIATWSHIDGDWASIYSTLLKADIEVGTSVYQAFNGLEVRKKMLFKAAEKAVPEWQKIAIEAVWKATAGSRNERDRFCHHVWGYSRDLPNALLLMDSSVVVDSNVSRRQKAKGGPGGSIIAPKPLDKSKILVYRKADFDKALEEVRSASWLVTLLYFAVGAHANEVGRRQLLKETAFQRAVEPLIRGKAPEVQAQLEPPSDAPPPKGTWDHLTF